VCLVESLIERDVFDSVDQMQRYLRWLRDGYNSSIGECFDIGQTTGDALYRPEREGIASFYRRSNTSTLSIGLPAGLVPF
jgi:hypothetical protein